MTTKEKILNKALELFNTEGVDAVTVRSIAKELEMSHGNLCYHYPSTDAILEALYYRLVDEQNAIIGGLQTDKIDLTFVYKMSKLSYEKLYEYRFLLLDFVHVMRRLPNLKTFHRQLSEMRRQQFQFLIAKLIENGVLKAPIFKNQYENWAHLAMLFGDFWLSSAEILYEGEEENKVKTYHHLFISLMTPYLTEGGLQQLEILLKD